MEPSLQPSFTFPSRHDNANRAVGLEAQLNMSHITTVPKHPTDINLETAFYPSNTVPPVLQKDTIDPDGVIPIAENIYVQPGLAEGMINLGKKSIDEDTIMRTLSSNNALKRGNYQAAEHVKGTPVSKEEIENKTTVPNVRASQHGGPDVHVGPRSEDMGTHVRPGPNYSSLNHMFTQLGNQIDVLAKQYNVPADVIGRLKTRYNLFAPADPSGRPNVPNGWKSLYEMLRRDVEQYRTQTEHLRAMGDHSKSEPGFHSQQPGPRGFTVRDPTYGTSTRHFSMQGGAIGDDEKKVMFDTPDIHRSQPTGIFSPESIETMRDAHRRRAERNTYQEQLDIARGVPGAKRAALERRMALEYPEGEEDEKYDSSDDSKQGDEELAEVQPVTPAKYSFAQNTPGSGPPQYTPGSGPGLVPAFPRYADAGVQTAPISSDVGVQTDQGPLGPTTNAFEFNNRAIASQNASFEGGDNAGGPNIPPWHGGQLVTPVIEEHLVNSINLTHKHANKRYRDGIYNNEARYHAPEFYGTKRRNLAYRDNDNIYTQLQNPVSYSQPQLSNEEKAAYVLHPHSGERQIGGDADYSLSHPHLNVHDRTGVSPLPGLNEEHENYQYYQNNQQGYNNVYLPPAARNVSQHRLPIHVLKGAGSRFNDHSLDGIYQNQGAPLTSQLLARTGHNAIPISAQVKVPNNRQLFEPGIREWIRDPSKAGEELRAELLPRPAPSDTTTSSERQELTTTKVKGNQVIFGKHYINHIKLLAGVVSLTDRNGKKVSRVKNEHLVVGSGLHNAMLAVVHGKKPQMKKLNPEEKIRLQSILAKSQVHAPMIGSDINVDPMHQIQIVMGEIDAGNDNPKLKSQLRKLLTYAQKTNLLDQSHISSFRSAYLS